MDCRSFRDHKLAAPRETTPAQLEHMRLCGKCAKYAHDVDAFEACLEQAAKVPVPEGLAEQIIGRAETRGWLRRLLDDAQRKLGGGACWLIGPSIGVAAAVLVLALAGVLTYHVSSGRTDLADRFIAHVESEPQLLTTSGTAEAGLLAAALAQYGGKLEAPVGEVRYVGVCLVDGVLAHHIVVETSAGPITLILMPGTRDSVPARTKGGLTAVVLPLAKGSMGIIASSPESASQAESIIKRNVRVEG